MSKLKIYTENQTLISVVEEHLLYLGKIDNSVIIKNKTFRDITNDDILKLIDYTCINNCDFIYYPNKINKNDNIESLIELSEKYNKKILLFYNDDDDTLFNFKNSLIFRTSLYKSRKPINYFSIPAFCNDLKNETKYFFREKNLIPTIGFCGAITHQYRKEIINYINNINNLKKNFIIRNDFWGGNIWGSNVRNEYINNTLNSDFVICVRGAGNFSYRFYETLCLGRIPIVLDTDLDLPFNDFIDYDNKILIIKINEINTIEHKILTFWDNIIDYKKLQLDLINFWSETLSPIGFIKTLNTHKNEINNILY